MRLFFLFLVFSSSSSFADSVSIDNPSLELVGPPAPVSSEARQKNIPCTRYDLHGAVQFKKLSCLEIAVHHMDINDRDINGDTPLHNAIHFKNAAAIRFLVKHGADIRLRDFHGMTAKELAESLNHRRLGLFFEALERESERLLEAVDANDVIGASNSLTRGASVGMRDIRLDTPLHKAAQSGLVEMAQLLIHHGAKLEARNYLGETPLHMAALRDHKEMVKALVEAGANVNAIDERRNTPLDIAERHSDPQILAMLQKKKARNGVPASVEFDFSGGEGMIVREGPVQP